MLTLAVVVLLSWATYRWVETPFRTGRTWRRPSRALLVYPASVGVVLATVVASTQVVSFRLGEWSDEPAISTADYEGERLGGDPSTALVRASVLAAREGRAVPGDLTPGLLDLRSQTAQLGDCDYRTGTTQLCPLGDPDADRDIVVLGDSHARALSPAIEKIGAEHGYRVHVLVFSGCTATALVQVRPDTGRAWEECERFKDVGAGDHRPARPGAGGGVHRDRADARPGDRGHARRASPGPSATSTCSAAAGRTCSRTSTRARVRWRSSATAPRSPARPASA